MRATDIFGGPFTPPGFYYKTFIRPRRLWPLYEKVLRHAAGLGRLRKSQPEREWRTEYRRRHADVLVVGGGVGRPVGGHRRRRAGGRRRARRRGPGAGRAPAGRGRRRATPASWRRGRAPPGWRCSRTRRRWAPSTASCRSGRATRCTRSAPGARSTPPARSSSRCMFSGNDLPGVMLSGGARRLIALYALSPGTRAVVATVGDRGLRRRAGAARRRAWRSACVADLRPNGASAAGRAARSAAACEVLRGATVLEARGRGQLERRRAGRARRRRRRRAHGRLRPAGGVRRQRARHLPASPRPAARTAYDASAATSRWPSCPPACTPPARCPAPAMLEAAELSGAVAGAEAAHVARLRRRRARAAGPRPIARRSSAAAWPPPTAVPPPRHERAQGQVLRLPVRGRDRQGHPPERRGGLRLDRALQALHDDDHGALPGPHVPAPRRPADGEGDRPEPRGGRAPPPRGRPGYAVPMGALAGRPFEPAKRSADPRPPPRARRQHHVGRRLAPRLRLRRPARRGARGARGGRA